jgi:hypothetical protein
MLHSEYHIGHAKLGTTMVHHTLQVGWKKSTDSDSIDFRSPFRFYDSHDYNKFEAENNVTFFKNQNFSKIFGLSFGLNLFRKSIEKIGNFKNGVKHFHAGL